MKMLDRLMVGKRHQKERERNTISLGETEISQQGYLKGSGNPLSASLI